MADEPKHCDDYIHDRNAPMALRFFLLVQRMPAVDKVLLFQNDVNPKLFADHNGERVQVVMASRMGDVGITKKLDVDHGYDTRVSIQDLTNFSNKA